MRPHQTRVVSEKHELDEKLLKLGSFINSEMFLELKEPEQNLLREQKDAMEKYSEILAKRIAVFESNCEH